MKVILVPLSGLSRDSHALEAAYALASPFHAHLDCLHVRPDPRLLVASTTAGMETGMGTGVFPAELWEAMVQADRRRAKQAHEMFDAFRSEHKFSPSEAPGVSAAYREIEGSERDVTANARYADLVVLTNKSLLNQTSLDATGDLIVGCGKPIFLALPTAHAYPLKTVIVAWKDTAEAARAVTAALPILQLASNVIVLTAREGSHKVEDAIRSVERVATLLKAHGIAARAEHVPVERKSVPDTIVERAEALSADLLVMGAYSHNRLRESLFGGFTQHILHEPKLPVLMAH
jgi:nucleotide-binding universal stress UspA family protein